MDKIKKFFEDDFHLWTPRGFLIYFCTILMGAAACSLILRWATNDSYALPAFKNKKRLHFGTSLGDAGATSFYRVREAPKRKRGEGKRVL